MWIQELRLNNFRNYSSETISFSPNINLIVGNNGEGKTNLLESLFLLATTRSYRQAQEKDMVLLNNDSFYVAGSIVLSGNIKHTLEITYSQKQKRKQAKASGIPITRLADFIGILNVVSFSPDDLDLIKGAPGLRRRFLDILLSQIDKIYLGSLQQYNRVLKQRNECLRAIQKGKMRTSDLWPWNEQLIPLACQIVGRRQKAVHELEKAFTAISQKINQGKEALSLQYISPLVKNKELLSVASIQELLAKKEHEDISRGITGLGPHRDDVFFSMNGLPAAEFASQGQQRTAVLSLKLAELEYMHKITGDYPILLLDDVFSELDQSRRELLITVLSGKIQALITGTEVPQLSLSAETTVPNIIQVRQGRVI